MFLWSAASGSESALADAWHMSAAFCAEMLSAFARYPAIILLYAAPPATYRAWVLLRTKPVPSWWLPPLEMLVFVWRVFMCAVAIWVVLTPPEMDELRATVVSGSSLMGTFERLSTNAAMAIWPLFWEIVFFAAAFILLNWLFGLIARAWLLGQDLNYEQKLMQRKAMTAVIRNLLLVPLALIYVVIMVRYILA